MSSANTVSGDQNDVFICKPLTSSATTNCTFVTFFDGDAVRFKYNVDDIALVAVSQLRPFPNVASATVGETENTQYSVGSLEARSQIMDTELSDEDLDRDELVTQKVFLPLIAQ